MLFGVLITFGLLAWKFNLNWLFYAFLIYLFAEINFDLLHRIFIKIKGITGNRPAGYAAVFTYLVVLIFFSYLTRKQISRIAKLCLAVVLISTFVTSGFGKGPRGTIANTQELAIKPPGKQPNIIILILDEHAGLEGLDGLIPELTEFKRNYQKWFVEKGFTVYGSAYSNFSESVSSIPDIINASDQNISAVTGGPQTYHIQHNAILKSLYQQDYRIHIYQSTYMDFCSSSDFKESLCVSYLHNPISLIEGTNLNLADKLQVVLQTWTKAQKSRYLKIAFQKAMEWAHISERGFTYSMAGVPMLKELTEDLKRNPSGTVFFVHLPLPHFPYVFTHDCQVNPVELWETRNEEKGNELRLKLKYYLYSEQLACLHSKLKLMIGALENTNAYSSTSILIFGDHGSRITSWDPKEENLDRATQQDVINTFVTFLAIKNGDLSTLPEGRYIEHQVPVAQVIANFFQVPYDKKAANVLHLLGAKKGTIFDVRVPEFQEWKKNPAARAVFQQIPAGSNH